MITTAGRFSLLRQLAWATTLAAGFATAWFLIVITLTTWIQTAWPGEKPRAYESVHGPIRRLAHHPELRPR